MKDYKRLTKRDVVGTCIDAYEFANEVKKWQDQHRLYDYMGADTTQILLERLADLEDKIENGTLIEMPRIVRRVDMSCGYEDYLVQWEKDNGKIKSRIYNNERRAKAKLRELQE